MREILLLDVPHRQVVLTIPKTLVTEGGIDQARVFHRLPHLDDSRLAETIRKVYEVDPMICPRCGGRMRVVAFLTGMLYTHP